MTPATGHEPRPVVVAAAAPLWESVEAAEEVAVFGGSSYSEYRAWARPLIADQGPLTGRLHTVALSGEPVRVLAEATPSFVRVELLAQPNGTSGYVGFMYAAHVGPDKRRTPTHIVVKGDVRGTALGREPAPVELAAGTTVELLTDGAGDGAEVMLASGRVVRCPLRALRPVGAGLPAVDVLRYAADFVGTPYLWGGVEAAGIDCSGLVHTAARMAGHVVPRDAHYQWAATRFDADWTDLDAGDLVFFGDDASLDGIDHVGLYAGEARMLHAPEAGRPVTVEPISARARRRAVGFGRCPAR